MDVKKKKKKKNFAVPGVAQKTRPSTSDGTVSTRSAAEDAPPPVPPVPWHRQSDAASSVSGASSLWRRSNAHVGHHVKQLGEAEATVNAQLFHGDGTSALYGPKFTARIRDFRTTTKSSAVLAFRSVCPGSRSPSLLTLDIHSKCVADILSITMGDMIAMTL